LIIIIQSATIFLDFSEDSLIVPEHVVEQFNRELDSLRRAKADRTSNKPFRYNPNYLNEHSAYILGLKFSEYKKLELYRGSGKYVNSENEFQQVTGISDSLMVSLETRLTWSNYKPGLDKSNTKQVTEKIVIKDLNKSSAAELQQVFGVGKVLSERIVKYRDMLGGFSLESQLFEVYNLKRETADKILTEFKIFEKPIIESINVNEATFKEILALPYIDYELTRKIVNFRSEVAEIKHIDELKKIDGFPLEKFDRIALYLGAK
jgi:DNA uptake protein ComE-like DNA-binding protein